MAASSAGKGNSYVTTTPGASMVWDGRSWTVVNLGTTQATLLSADGTLIELPQTTFEDMIKAGRLANPADAKALETHPAIQEILSRASPSDFAEANRRYAIIAPGWLVVQQMTRIYPNARYAAGLKNGDKQRAATVVVTWASYFNTKPVATTSESCPMPHWMQWKNSSPTITKH